MNIVPVGSFFQTVSGSAAQSGRAHPSSAVNATLQAQAAAAENRPDSELEQTGQPAPRPFGPRGSIIDIVA